MFKQSVVVTAILLTTSVAWAGPQCNAPKSQWQDPVKFQEQLKSEGYEIRKFKLTKGQCYEIYGYDKSGQRVEIYFDPQTGKAIHQK